MSSIGPPAPPNRPEISKISETGVSITWSDPIDDGGSEVTGYTIHVLNELEEVVITKTCPPTVQQLLLESLHYGPAYTFKVSASNQFGEGSFSEPSDVLMLLSNSMSGPRRGLVEEDITDTYNLTCIIARYQPA